jgi:uncharacterized protein YecE (DUF72 family)
MHGLPPGYERPRFFQFQALNPLARIVPHLIERNWLAAITAAMPYGIGSGSLNCSRGSRDASASLSSVSRETRSHGFIGTSGWAYPSWKPAFYPQALPQKKFLEYYATQLNSVEVNYTFRQLPTPAMLANWLAASNADFRFSFKAPQRLTHILRLRNCSKIVDDLSRVLAPVVAARRMGVVLFQLPPNFKADVPLLDAFLADASQSKLRTAFEFRHAAWFCDEAYEVLRRHDVALCVAESDELQTPDVATAPFTCYRFRRSEYSAAQIDAIEKTLRRRSRDGEVFAYFKHEKLPTGALCAIELLQKLQRP